MCRVCLKRPEIPDERYGRCESCAKNGRVAFRFRLGRDRSGDGLVVRAGELSPRALRQKWREPLAAFKGQAAAKPHLGLHEMELITARDRLESVRMAQDLAAHADEALAALRAAAERTDGAW
ncbi:MAG: hypothetical protein DLM65_15285 [Candidatus Aeolococcus gillhamiae]|uniref:Uncharacterized protein n=1 Tax=Candidatus Aeolococcus gillhamiae TaxID=3127015 RepID=A0A2W5YXI3_9BACT|nr:MAG: hypothetical protein DLM65_15285 [Candidatus Dormibacter sp. RRmetagenome_bin12]